MLRVELLHHARVGAPAGLLLSKSLGERMDPLVLEEDTREKLVGVAATIDDEREEQLLLAEVRDRVGGIEREKVACRLQPDRLVAGRGPSETTGRHERVVVIVRQRHERAMALHANTVAPSSRRKLREVRRASRGAFHREANGE